MFCKHCETCCNESIVSYDLKNNLTRNECCNKRDGESDSFYDYQCFQVHQKVETGVISFPSNIIMYLGKCYVAADIITQGF